MGRSIELSFPTIDIFGAQIDGKRDYQEDVFQILLNPRDRQSAICLLADGMGGHAAGDVAANLAVTTFANALDSIGDPAHSEFMRCLDEANRGIGIAANENAAQAGMGTTLVALEVLGTTCNWISVGDSPLFHVRGDKIQRLNVDHSMAKQLDAAARRGEISEDEAKKSPSRSMLLSALTGDSIKRVDYRAEGFTLENGDWLVLGSDGIETLQPDEIVQIIGAADLKSAKYICNAILSGVEMKKKAHQDNATAIVVKCQFGARSSTDMSSQDEVRTRPIMR